MASKCPICNADVEPRGENKVFPFCSARCKTIDLGKWLSEEYRVPTDDDVDVGDEDRSRSPGDVRH